MDALSAEVRRLGERLGRLSLDTVFIGGGTPSLVEPELLAGLVATVREHVLGRGRRRGDHGGEPLEHQQPTRRERVERRRASTGSASGCRASRPTC